MKLKDAIKKAVDNKDASMAGKIVDTLRYHFTFDYDRVFNMFHRLTNITKEDFEKLMYETSRYR